MIQALSRERPRVRSTILTGLLKAMIVAYGIALAARLRIFLPFSPVPVTAQTLVVLLAGVSLEPWVGALAFMAYVAGTSAGLPMLAGPSLVGPTGGYVMGFGVALVALGWLRQAGYLRSVGRLALAMIGANLLIYGIGLPWLAQFVGWHRVLALGLYPFVAGDLAKLCIALWLARAVGVRGAHR
ncbi:MAG TPA: biotin transporter BioY [Chloroflexi bacterium]|nr:biotin transporter BioY [Chloroflexota bacterium]